MHQRRAGESGETAPTWAWPRAANGLARLKSRNLDFRVTSRCCRIDCGCDRGDRASNARPARRGQYDHAESAGRQRLLMLELRVGSDEYLEAFIRGGNKQFAVLQPRPGSLVIGHHFKTPRILAKWDRGALIEKYAHLDRGQCTARRMLQNRPNLRQRHAGEPLDELGRVRAVFEILEQRCDGHAGTAKNPVTAVALRVALDGNT